MSKSLVSSSKSERAARKSTYSVAEFAVSQKREQMKREEVVFLFDLDGTLTKDELLPLIARRIGVEDLLNVITTETITGQIPFQESFRRRFEMLRSVPQFEVSRAVLGAEMFKELVEFISINLDKCLIVTGNLDVWIQPLLDTYDWVAICSTSTLSDQGELLLDSILDKSEVVRLFDDCIVVAIGDGANDSEMLRDATVGIGFEGVHACPPKVRDSADQLVATEGDLCQLLKTL